MNKNTNLNGALADLASMMRKVREADFFCSEFNLEVWDDRRWDAINLANRIAQTFDMDVCDVWNEVETRFFMGF